MATSKQLTATYRSQQVRRAGIIATLVAAYYRTRVDVEDPEAVEEWLDLMLPRILSGKDTISRLAARYATDIRRLELPNEPPLTFTASEGSVAEQIRKSLLVVGPGDYLNKAREIKRLDIGVQQQRALLAEAKQVTTKKVAASVIRHAQSGGRATIIDAAARDDKALGYVRVTRENPCFFCAMLASRGLVFASDSFDESDPRFTGAGTVKVHDECGCSMKAVYVKKDDEAYLASQEYADLWSRWGAGGGDAALRFRRGYEHYKATGDYLSWDVANDPALYRARNSS